MDFVHFGLLPLFLPLAALPILLQLLTLRRLKTVELSTFRFLVDSDVYRRRRRRFRDLLIALLRSAVILLVVLAAARPVSVQRGGPFRQAEHRGNVRLLIDTSASMGAVHDGVSSLTLAKLTAREMVTHLQADDRAAVYEMTTQVNEVCSRFALDREGICQKVDQLHVSSCRANLFAALRGLLDDQTRQRTHSPIYLFTDLQRNAWKELAEQAPNAGVPESVRIVVVDVGSKTKLPNRSISGETPDQGRAVMGLPVTLKMRVANYADQTIQELPVRLFMNDREVLRTRVSMDAGEERDVKFVYTPTRSGHLRGRVEIAEDRFAADDCFRFSLEVVPRVRVLLVNGHPSTEPLEDEGFYLRMALATTDLPMAASTGSPAAQNVFDVVEVGESEVTPERLLEADAAILADCGAWENPEPYCWLREFVAGGGGLLIFPGEHVQPDRCSEAFFANPEMPSEPLVAARLGEVQNGRDTTVGGLEVDLLGLDHPIFEPFAGEGGSCLARLRVRRYYPLSWTDARSNTWMLAQFSDGTPAILESRLGRGRVLLWAFPANSRWSNVTLRPEFVPLVLRMLDHVRQRSELTGPTSVPAGRVAEFQLPLSWAPVVARVKDVRGHRKPVRFERSNGRLVGAFAETWDAGRYALDVVSTRDPNALASSSAHTSVGPIRAETRTVGSRTALSQRGEWCFVVNGAPEESDFSRCSESEIHACLPGARVTIVDAAADAPSLFGGVGEQRELTRPLLWLVLVGGIVEFLLCTAGGHAGRIRRGLPLWRRAGNLVQGTWLDRWTGVGMEND